MKTQNLDIALDDVAYRLRLLRTRKGFTSSVEFAKKYDLPEKLYWKMENGKRSITLTFLIHVLHIHQLSLEEFFCMDIKKAAA